MVLQQEIESWGKFRRGLRREDQEAMDDLFRAARAQLAGAAYAARPIPFESMVMAMLLMQHRAILELRRTAAAPVGQESGTTPLPLLNRIPPVQPAGGDDGSTDDHRLAV
jgi:hypothetical protein